MTILVAHLQKPASPVSVAYYANPAIALLGYWMTIWAELQASLDI